MSNYCWDCFYFKTREFTTIDKEMKKTFCSLARIQQELNKAKREKRYARYWRCILGRTKCEVYTLEKTARILKACNIFNDKG